MIGVVDDTVGSVLVVVSELSVGRARSHAQTAGTTRVCHRSEEKDCTRAFSAGEQSEVENSVDPFDLAAVANSISSTDTGWT